MRKILLISGILLCVFGANSVFAQEQGFLKGKITDFTDNKDLFAANVAIKKDGDIIKWTTTNFDGVYTISLDPGIYTVEVSFILFCKERKEIEIISGDTTELDFQLYEARFDIETIFDTITIKAIELDSLNIRFKVVLDDHIKNIKRIRKDKYCILVKLDLYIDEKDQGYFLRILTLRNDVSYMYDLCRRETYYYYKYKGWDVFFMTYLNVDFPNTGNPNIDFPKSGTPKELKYNLKYKDRVIRANGKYDMGEFEYYGRKIGKPKEYSIRFDYYLLNDEVERFGEKHKLLFHEQNNIKNERNNPKTQ